MHSLEISYLQKINIEMSAHKTVSVAHEITG